MIRYLLAAILSLTSSADAVELHHIVVRTGTDGLQRVPLTISNEAKEAVSCNADFAHWYSAGVASADPGKTARLELWLDPSTGTLSLLNDKRENLPVERLWCGLSGRAYATRSQIALDEGVGAVAARIVVCNERADRLVCG